MYLRRRVFVAEETHYVNEVASWENLKGLQLLFPSAERQSYQRSIAREREPVSSEAIGIVLLSVSVCSSPLLM